MSGSVNTLYKDIELIPIGIPSSSVAKVQLPSLGSSKNKELPVPEPFGNWKLDLVVKTQDPILIRGNVATGRVEGEVHVSGPLKRPKPKGRLYVREVEASLPFSQLEIAEGEIIFTPELGIMNPKLKILGTSTISGYDVNLLVYGETANPQTILTSSPPLPESEITSLLGTGSTTNALGNTNAVALKALQILLIQLRDRNTIPGGNRLFGALLGGIEKANLQVGENDTFSGRKFTSASINLQNSWYFTTQIDEEQRARGLLVYKIRFK